MKRRVLLSLLFFCLCDVAGALAQDLPRVRLVATGGTISNKNGGRGRNSNSSRIWPAES